MQTSTVLPIASASKQYTALVVLRLVEQGRIGLDDDVGDRLGFAVRNPRFPAVAISPRLLLCHGSSIVDGPPLLAGYAAGDPTVPLGRWLRTYLADAAHFLDRPPGTEHRYANAGYGLLGELVGGVTGEDFRDHARRILLEPLGLAGSGWSLAELERTALARNYVHADELEPELRHLLTPDAPAADGWSPLAPYGFPTYPDGLLRTTATGLARLGRLLLGGGTVDGTTLLAPTTIAAACRVQPAGGGAYGLGLRRFAPRIWGHLGGDPGVASGLWLDLDARRGVVLVSNSATWDLASSAILDAGRRSG